MLLFCKISCFLSCSDPLCLSCSSFLVLQSCICYLFPSLCIYQSPSVTCVSPPSCFPLTDSSHATLSSFCSDLQTPVLTSRTIISLLYSSFHIVSLQNCRAYTSLTSSEVLHLVSPSLSFSSAPRLAAHVQSSILYFQPTGYHS